MEAYLDRANAMDREKLAPLRGAYWKGELSVEQFQERNRRLYEHPFGQERMETLLLRLPSGEVQSSLDLLQINLMIKNEQNRVEVQPAIIIASVLTLEKHQGKGGATRLMGEVVQLQERPWSVLYSDINPEFYERFKFVKFPVSVAVGEAKLASTPPKLRALKPAEFLDHLSRAREKSLLKCKGLAVGVQPESGFWDWQLERYRYFAELSKKNWELNPFWEVQDGAGLHPVAVAPDYVHDRLDGLWVCPTCEQPSEVLGHLASQAGVSTFRFWSATAKEGKTEYPMVRAPLGGASPSAFEVQLGEWW